MPDILLVTYLYTCSETSPSWRPFRHISEEFLARVQLAVHRHARGWGARGHRDDDTRTVSVLCRSIYHNKHKHTAVVERLSALSCQWSAGQDGVMDAAQGWRLDPHHIWPAYVQWRLAVFARIRRTQRLETSNTICEWTRRRPVRVSSLVPSTVGTPSIPNYNWWVYIEVSHIHIWCLHLKLQFLMWKFSTSEDQPHRRSTTRLVAQSSYSVSSQRFRIRLHISPGVMASVCSTTTPVVEALGKHRDKK